MRRNSAAAEKAAREASTKAQTIEDAAACK
jgi:hypothetical protein